MSPESTVTRETLEDSWRLRVEETRVLYHKAQDRYRQLLGEQPDGTAYDPNSAIALARQAESQALAEYSRILRAFTDLSVNGKIPEERSMAGSDRI